MNIRALTVAVLLFLVIVPRVVTGQTPQTARPGLDRFTFQAGAGPLWKSGGHTLSAAFGFSPISRLDLMVNVERDHLPFQRETFSGRYSLTRGGTLTTVSGEVRASGTAAAPRIAVRLRRDGRRRIETNRQRCVSHSGRERSADRVFRRWLASSDTRRTHHIRRRARDAGIGRRRRLHWPLARARRRRVALLD